MPKYYRLNDEGYIERRSRGNAHSSGNRRIKRHAWYDWWFIKWNYTGDSGNLHLTNISLPSNYVGKKIKIKIELIEEE